MLFLAFLVRITGYFLSLLLLVRFLMRIYEPGNAQNAAILSFLRMIYAFADPVLNAVKAPVDFLLALLSVYLPLAVNEWFPRVGAAKLADTVTDWFYFTIPNFSKTPIGASIAATDFSAMFPGMIDWSYLVAIMAISLVVNLITGIFGKMQGLAMRRRRHELNRQLGIEMSEKTRDRKTATAPTYEGSTEKNLLFNQVVKGVSQGMGALAGNTHVDTLTHLFNKNHFHDRVQKDIEQVRPGLGYVSIVFADFDNFRAINEKFGPNAGDRILQEAGRILTSLQPASGKAYAGRFGPEELALALIDTPPEAVREMANALLAQFAGIFLPDIPKARVTASIGVYSVRFVPSNGSAEMGATELVRKAESEMQKAKRAGKNNVQMSVLP